jgi:hypothetical protein
VLARCSPSHVLNSAAVSKPPAGGGVYAAPPPESPQEANAKVSVRMSENASVVVSMILLSIARGGGGIKCALAGCHGWGFLRLFCKWRNKILAGLYRLHGEYYCIIGSF